MFDPEPGAPIVPLYNPREQIRQVGDMLAAAIFSPPVGAVVARVLEPLTEDAQLAYDHFAARES